MELIKEVVSFVLGGLFGSLLTLHFKKQKATGKGNVVDQSESRAGNDIVGRDKRG